MTSPADKLDLDLLRKQDVREFGRMVRAYEGFVLGLCQTLGLSAADRDDAAAETFAMAYRALPQFRGDAQLATWLYRIAYRTAIRVRRRYPALPAEGAEAADGTPGPPSAAEAREAAEAVWRAVARLEPEQAAAIEMFYRRGMAVEAIAEVMEKPLGTVKTLLFRARERLRWLLRALEKTP